MPYMWNLKRNDTNVLTYRTERDSQTEKTNTVAGVVGAGGWQDRQFGMVLYTLLYLKLIIDKDLLYGTWNSAQSFVTAWVGGQGKLDSCICMVESLCCSPETITTLLIGYTLNTAPPKKEVKK